MLNRSKKLGPKRFLVVYSTPLKGQFLHRTHGNSPVFPKHVSVVIDFVRPVCALQNRKSRG